MYALGDATKVTANICHNFNAVELYGLRELMVNFDYRHLDEYEAIWKKAHPGEDAIAAAAAVEQSRRPSDEVRRQRPPELVSVEMTGTAGEL